MASKALRGLTIEIGGDTTELNKALDNVDKRTRNLSSELRDIDRALKLDPTNTELVAQKQKVLADAISSTKERLGLLKEAEKQAQKQFERGEITEEQYRAIRREVIATENKLKKLKEQAEELADANGDVADSADDAGDELDKEGDKADKAKKETEELDEASNDLAAGGLAAVVAAATAAVTAIVALAESSREYRTEMAKLDTAFQDNSFSAEAATRTYEALQSVLGETDQAVEAANNLAALCATEEELNDWTEILTGVYGKFGASLPVEGLAEAANETMRVGQVTGPLADALNWAAAEGETFGVTLKKNTKANAEWNEKVKEATSAEDYFNLALEQCSDEQERQQLITETLTKLYGGAATQFKKTNKEVIRANEATEKWNKATAKVGKAVEPVVTDIKELGVTLLEDASEPLEDIANYIRKTVIPAIEKVGKWVKNNIPVIKAGLIAVTTAMVAFKVATVANVVAQKGLKKAIKETAIAQKALNLVQKATPLGLVLAGVVALTVALAAYAAATKKAKEPVDVLTKEERELMAAADEAAQAFREQKKATDEAMADITSQMDYTKKLADELTGLADASGKVKEKDQERARFILNELNEALGTEYKMVDGVIKKYDELESSIHDVIQAKLANSLIEAANADYVTAQQEEAAALENATLKWEDYQAQVETATAAQEKADQAWQTYSEMVKKGMGEMADGYYVAWERAQKAADNEAAILTEKETAYNDAALVYGQYYNTIATYEEAQAAALSGNYDLAVDLLKKKGGAFGSYSEKVDEETAKVLDTLYKEAVDAGLEARRMRSNFEKGVDGYTEEMVKEAETNYNKAMEEFANAYADAEGVGEDMAEGMTAGAENKRPGLLSKARSLVAGFLAAARDEADTHSPSKKTIEIFEDIGEGAVVGTENKTEDVKKAAQHQMAEVLDSYGSPELNAQKVYRSIAERQSARQLSGQQALASSNGPMLERILTAIEKGQVIALDGDAIVGATADRMDSALGRRRTLASRGAI